MDARTITAIELLERLRRRAGRGFPDPPASIALPMALGVFFIFSEIGWASVLASAEMVDVAAACFTASIAGTVAAACALTMMYRRWWLVVLTVLLIVAAARWSFDLVTRFYAFHVPSDPAAARITVMWLSLAALTLGFALFMNAFTRLRKDSLARQAELNVATAIHRSLVPMIDRRLARAEVYGLSLASGAVGGDLIEVISHADGDDVVVADVSGHGVRAGVVMAMLKSSLRTSIHQGGTLAEALRRVDRAMSELIDEGMFVTMAVVRIPTSGDLEVALAGHPPLMVRAVDGTLRSIGPDFPPLGLNIDAPGLVRTVSVMRGETVLILTDGLPETRDRRGRFYGTEPIERGLAEAGSQTLSSLCATTLDAVHAFGEPNDDQSLVLIRFT